MFKKNKKEDEFKKRFNFIEKTNRDGETSLVPYLPLKLTNKNYSLKTLGLLDTGASVNVLPYQLGLELGLNWENLNILVSLTGNLAQFPAKGVILKAEIETFSSVVLAFAWTQSNDVPLILGRVNFFQEFDVCFYGSQAIFEIAPKSNFVN
jgi:hypothetical protein